MKPVLPSFPSVSRRFWHGLCLLALVVQPPSSILAASGPLPPALARLAFLTAWSLTLPAAAPARGTGSCRRRRGAGSAAGRRTGGD